jgi:stage V sporulation protein AB
MEGFILILFLICAGAAGGVTIASLFVALDIIPRLNLSLRNNSYEYRWQNSVLLGCIISTIVYSFDIRLYFADIFSAIVGMLYGVFIGMLAGALTEVLNIIPIITKKFKLKNNERTVINSLIIGKTIGALFFFLKLYFKELFL